MIVTCERCASQFQLDETKIPSKGVRLRCSHCEHSFFVESPARPDTDHAADLVRDVLGDAKRDSDAPNPPSSSEFPTDSSGSPVLEPAEDDWEFNDDGGSIASPNDGGDGASTDELSAARDAVDDLLGGEPNLGISTTVAEAADPESSSALDLDDDFRLDVDSHWQADGAGESGSIDAPVAASVAAIVEDAHETPEPGAGIKDEPESAAESGDDFDDPANWDLFDSETARAAAVGAFEPQLPSKSPVSDSATPIGEPRVALSGVTAPTQSKLPQRLLGIAGWMVVAPLLLVSLIGGLKTPNLQPELALESATVAGFELQDVSARWIDNAIAGPVYVITGKLRGEASTVSNVAPLAVRLLDAKGQPLDFPAIAVGPRISERFLREKSPTDLVEFQKRRAAHLATTAGSWLGFAAVVPTVPNLAERFEFSSLKPGAGY